MSRQAASTARPVTVPPSGGRAGLAVYYGYGRLEQLAAYRTVVLQPGAYTPAEMAWLRARGVQTLAYLSLGEDAAAEPAAWHLPGLNAAWGTRPVQPGHPGWRARVLDQVRGLEHFDGFFLDTLEHRERSEMLALIASVRACAGARFLIANRGASLLPELGALVDGVLIEAFSSTWEPFYRPHDPQGLEYTAALLARLRAHGLAVWGLDYADTPELAAFAGRRADELGLSTFVGRRNLDSLPEGSPGDWIVM